MTLRAYSFVVFVLLSSNFSFSQLTIKEADFNSKTILSKIFHGEFQDDNNVQRWPVSSVQSLELNGYVDGNNFSYTSVDTIINLNVDTTNYKIIVFATFEVDSSGRIQDCMGCPPLIGLACFSNTGNIFELNYFNLNLVQQGHGWFLPYSRIEQIGPDKYALVLTDEVVQDYGTEVWYELFYDSRIFLSFTHTTIDYSEKSIFNENPTNYITNKIEIIKTESEYYDLILHSTIVPVNEIESKQSKKTRILKTKIKFNNEEGSNFLKIPNGYSIQPK
jgi:hypothetical protein